jgi:hypothetical protein
MRCRQALSTHNNPYTVQETERTLTEEGEHEDAIIPYPQLVSIVKLILLKGEIGNVCLSDIFK